MDLGCAQPDDRDLRTNAGSGVLLRRGSGFFEGAREGNGRQGGQSRQGARLQIGGGCTWVGYLPRSESPVLSLFMALLFLLSSFLIFGGDERRLVSIGRRRCGLASWRLVMTRPGHARDHIPKDHAQMAHGWKQEASFAFRSGKVTASFVHMVSCLITCCGQSRRRFCFCPGLLFLKGGATGWV